MENVRLNLIDGYFAGELDEEDMALVEERWKNDPAFKKLFNQYNDLIDGVEYSVLKTTKEDLQDLEASLPDVKIEKQVLQDQQKQAISRTPRFVWWKIAAAFLVLALSTTMIVYYQMQSQPEVLYNKYFEPYPNEFYHLKRDEISSSDLKLQAFQAYDNNDFQTASAGINTWLDGHEDEDIMVLFYLGNAQLAEGEYQEAIISFRKFLEDSDDFNTKTKWYLALAYTKEQQIEEAQKLFNELKDDSEYGSRARRILAKLN